MRFLRAPLACLVSIAAGLTPLQAQHAPGTPAPHLAKADESVQIAQGRVTLTQPAGWQSISAGEAAPGLWVSLFFAPRLPNGAVAQCTILVDTRPWTKGSNVVPPEMRQKAQWSTEDWKRHFHGPFESVDILQTKAWSASGMRVQQVSMTASARKWNDNTPRHVKIEERSYLSADGAVQVNCAARTPDPAAVSSVYRSSRADFTKVFDSVHVQLGLSASSGSAAAGKEREGHTLYIFPSGAQGVWIPTGWRVSEAPAQPSTMSLRLLAPSNEQGEPVNCLINLIDAAGRLVLNAGEHAPLWAEATWRDWLKSSSEALEFLERSGVNIANQAAQRAVYKFDGTHAVFKYNVAQTRMHLTPSHVWMLTCVASGQTAEQAAALYKRSLPAMDGIMGSFYAD
ncbi:hypothetical protein FOC84_05935 [Achromobacter pestifer]|uniref:DUF1795 domain-containing protein n=1 Tax=Achromobacter pestifer TaxID=1353889 RepID=A0A7D4HP62_9BURK|nr:hypothetical protein [Achromobacter pestifer]QKH34517.1 hypothetical protein FOC84_05935 [Achromobacter pestifer]